MRNVRIPPAHGNARSCLQIPLTSILIGWTFKRRTSACVYDLNEKTIEADIPLRCRDSRRDSCCSANASRIKRRRRLRNTAVYALLDTA
jgi:hypothetical protein